MPTTVCDSAAYEQLRRDFAHDPKMLAQLAEEERIWSAAPTTIPPCPSWCRQDAGHRYESTEHDGVTFVRYHSATSGNEAPDVEITQEERNREGEVTVAQPVIALYPQQGLQEVDPARAREIGSTLLQVANDLERIRGDA